LRTAGERSYHLFKNLPLEVDMSPIREELITLAEAFKNETDTEKLLRLSKRLLDVLNRVEIERNESVRLT